MCAIAIFPALCISVTSVAFTPLSSFINYDVFCFDTWKAISFILNSYNLNSVNRIIERIHCIRTLIKYVHIYSRNVSVVSEYYVCIIERSNIGTFG